MTQAEIADHIGTTAVDLSTKIREAILAGNAGAAVDWAAALRDTAVAFAEVTDEEG
jgi:hypothetical protein